MCGGCWMGLLALVSGWESRELCGSGNLMLFAFWKVCVAF